MTTGFRQQYQFYKDGQERHFLMVMDNHLFNTKQMRHSIIDFVVLP